MNDQLPAPPHQMPSMSKPWMAWIFAASVMPALSIFLMGKNANDLSGTIAIILLAMVAQLACSIWLAKSLAARGNKSSTFIALVAVLLMVASSAIGTASFFAACVTIGPAMNLH